MDIDLLIALNPEADFPLAGTEIMMVDPGEDQSDRAVVAIEADKVTGAVLAYDDVGLLVAYSVKLVPAASEHAFANAVDIMEIRFQERTAMPVSEKEPETGEALFQAEIRNASGAYFTMVLGSGTDAMHHDHFHFDMRQRNNDYRICQ